MTDYITIKKTCVSFESLNESDKYWLLGYLCGVYGIEVRYDRPAIRGARR